jgi:hypothetical protein
MTALAPVVSNVLLLIAALQLKHFICDGPLQTKAMVDDKRRYGALRGLLHAGIHGLGTLLVMLVYLGLSPFALWLALADAIIHYHVDFSKENVVRQMGWTPAQGPFWWAMSFDQMLHQLTYTGLAAITIAAT